MVSYLSTNNLLDEPGAGLSRGDSEDLIEMIQCLTKDTTVFFCGGVCGPSIFSP